MILLKSEGKIGESKAMDFLIDLALYSNYIPFDGPYPGMRPARVSAVSEYLQWHGTTIPAVAAEMASYDQPPRFFYNLVGPTWQTKGVKVSRTDRVTGAEKVIIDGDGQYHTANYWAKFEQAFDDFQRAVTEGNHELLLSSFAKGQASVENFLNTLDIPGIKNCSVEEKLEKVWNAGSPRVPWSMARTQQPWASFIEMKKVRNKQEIHNKDDASGFTYKEIHQHFNLFAPSIARTLFDLHKLTKIMCPASVIRASYFPNINQVQQPDPAQAEQAQPVTGKQ